VKITWPKCETIFIMKLLLAINIHSPVNFVFGIEVLCFWVHEFSQFLTKTFTNILIHNLLLVTGMMETDASFSCSHCNEVLETRNGKLPKFCPECGAPIEIVSPKPELFCPECSTERTVNSKTGALGKFCSECSYKFLPGKMIYSYYLHLIDLCMFLIITVIYCHIY